MFLLFQKYKTSLESEDAYYPGSIGDILQTRSINSLVQQDLLTNDDSVDGKY